MVLALSLAGAAHALSDTEPRALALGQAYTALARGPEAVFWNPANLALGGEPKLKWEMLGAGLTLITENNSFSVRTYNEHFTDDTHRIGTAEKEKLLGDIPKDGLRFNSDLVPFLSAGLPRQRGHLVSAQEWNSGRGHHERGLRSGGGSAEGHVRADVVRQRVRPPL